VYLALRLMFIVLRGGLDSLSKKNANVMDDRTADNVQYMNIQQTINLWMVLWFAEQGIDFVFSKRIMFISRW